MITFKLFEGDQYLCDGTDPANAHVGFFFQHNPNELPPTFQLDDTTWLDPSQKGYFAFFPPVAPGTTRDWATFATKLRSQFEGRNRAQFGWFTTDGTVIEFVIVDAQTPPGARRSSSSRSRSPFEASGFRCGLNAPLLRLRNLELELADIVD